MLIEDRTASDATPLRNGFPDAVNLAGDAGWDAARSAFNLLVA
jgi:hypothetical protein